MACDVKKMPHAPSAVLFLFLGFFDDAVEARERFGGARAVRRLVSAARDDERAELSRDRRRRAARREPVGIEQVERRARGQRPRALARHRPRLDLQPRRVCGVRPRRRRALWRDAELEHDDSEREDVRRRRRTADAAVAVGRKGRRGGGEGCGRRRAERGRRAPAAPAVAAHLGRAERLRLLTSEGSQSLLRHIISRSVSHLGREPLGGQAERDVVDSGAERGARLELDLRGGTTSFISQNRASQ